LESEWRWGLAESGLDPETYGLASRDLMSPEFIWAWRRDTPDAVFALYEDPLFPEELAYEVQAYPEWTMQILADAGIIVQDWT